MRSSKRGPAIARDLSITRRLASFCTTHDSSASSGRLTRSSIRIATSAPCSEAAAKASSSSLSENHADAART